jgi:hypothetical protein
MSLRSSRSLLLLLAAIVMLRCGSSPAGPSGGVKLQGVVLQNATGTVGSASASAPSAQGGRITVTVQEDPSLKVTVSGNGTFELQGLPAGGFTLVFSLNGVTVGQITITPVGEGTTIKIVVSVTANEVVLIEIETEGGDADNGDDPAPGTGTGTGGDATKSCMIEGGKVGSGIELEGNVDSGSSGQFKLRVNGNRSSGLVDVAASGASYKCNGNNKGATDCKTNLRSGAKVHVRGSLTTCSTTAASVTATEVMIQKD